MKTFFTNMPNSLVTLFQESSPSSVVRKLTGTPRVTEIFFWKDFDFIQSIILVLMRVDPVRERLPTSERHHGEDADKQLLRELLQVVVNLGVF